MTFDRLPFESVFADESGGNIKTPQSEYLAEGKFPIVDQGKALVGGYTDHRDRLCGQGRPAIVFGDHTRCVKFIDFPFCMGADGVKILRPRIEADLKYLYHFLGSIELPSAGYDRHYKYLKRLEVVVPPLPEQRRIAAILDQTDALRAKRREALAQLDSLTRSIFIEMFGDPAANPRGWPQLSVGNTATKFSGDPFGSNLKSSDYTEAGVRVIRLQNIGVGEMVDRDKAFVSEGHFNKFRKHECLPGDVLIATLGDPNLRACIQPSTLARALNKAACVQLRPDPRIANAEYLCALLNQPAVESMAQVFMLGQTRVRISMDRLRGLRVPVPPLALQQTFATRIQASKPLTAPRWPSQTPSSHPSSTAPSLASCRLDSAQRPSQQSPMRPTHALNQHRDAIRAIAKRCRVTNVRVFGSVLHGTDTEASDLDLLVDPTSSTSLMDIGRIELELSALLQVSVDVLTPKGLPEKL